MAWIGRVANVFRQRRLLGRLDEELAFHLAERIDELVAGGLSPDEAQAEALRRFGNYTRQRERTRDMDIVAWLEALIADLWRPGRRNAWTLRNELRRVETIICDTFWPRWREVA